MAKQSMSYETVMIFNTQQGEEGIAALSDKFKTLIAENGTIDKVDEWGKRRLAYPIDDELDGHYLLVEFTSSPDFPAELDRVYKITDGVLRTLIVCKEEDKGRSKKGKAEEEVKPEIPEVKVEAKPEVKAEAKPEVQAEAKPEVQAEAEPEVKTEAEPEVQVEAKPEEKA